jgi:hypothetical protein
MLVVCSFFDQTPEGVGEGSGVLLYNGSKGEQFGLGEPGDGGEPFMMIRRAA